MAKIMDQEKNQPVYSITNGTAEKQNNRQRTFSVVSVDGRFPSEDLVLTSRPKLVSVVSYTAKTHWPSIWLTAATTFFVAVQFAVYFSSLWPYLETIDEGIEFMFFGYITSAFSFGQMIGSFVFGYWSQRIRNARYPVCAGSAVSLVSSLVYGFAEAFPQADRKWVMLIARLFTGFGAGVVGVLRAYAATASAATDRSRAISIVTAAWALGLMIGPGLQVVMRPIGRNLVAEWPFYLNLYTAPAFLAAIVNLMIIILMFVVFKENYAGIETEKLKTDDTRYKFTAKRVPKFNKLAAAICISGQFAMMATITNLESINAPYTEAMYSWSAEDTTLYIGLALSAAGLFSFLIYIFFALKGGMLLQKYNVDRQVIIAGFTILILYHFVTFPWPFYTDYPEYRLTLIGPPLGNESMGLQLNVNTTTISPSPTVETVGCNIKFHWCEYTPRVPLPLYLGAYVLMVGGGLSIVNVPLATLFSRILGPRRQGTMQGINLVAGSAARAIGPLFVTKVFESFGPQATWGGEAVMLIVLLLPWLIFYRQMVPLDAKPQLKKAGEYYKYKDGMAMRM